MSVLHSTKPLRITFNNKLASAGLHLSGASSDNGSSVVGDFNGGELLFKAMLET